MRFNLPDRGLYPDFIMHARIGMMRALNHGKPIPATLLRHKRVKAYRTVR
ncbi:hypothetical protein SAMN05443247_11775 [Bradyrhizobium erythrophlei]|jgi:hypothetical protein|nr:hypothetical protein SAMN05443247_11775 [Bradyrhizobium erythrophlei]